MNESTVILLIQEGPEGNEWIRLALEQHLASPFRLQTVERLPTALARITLGKKMGLTVTSTKSDGERSYSVKA